MSKCAVITGITGQDGSYLAELLLAKGYEVHGLVRPVAADVSPAKVHSGAAELLNSPQFVRIKHLLADSAIHNRSLFLHPVELHDSQQLSSILREAKPEEIYHLASQTSVGQSFENVVATCETTGMGTLRVLESVRQFAPKARFFHASSSEIFGRPQIVPQDETATMRPVTPYGCAKAFATNLVSIYRQTFALFAVNGILYNHESPRRGANFVTQKICLAAAAIKQGRQQELLLGSTHTQRDWGDARDYVRGMWLALQHLHAEDFVFATGEVHTVQEVIEIAFGALELDWRKYVRHDARFVRPEEPARLIGNATKARHLLDWQSTTPFRKLITEMTLECLSSPPA